MRSFFGELRRRNVLRAGALYVAGVWALAQGIAQLGPTVGAPEWTTRWFLVAAVIGAPFWIAFAWCFEFTPEGLKRESDINPSESITAHTGKKLDRWIIGILTVAIVLLLTNTFVWRKGAGFAATPDSALQIAASIPSIETDPSIAVLPFVNMSSDVDNQYFSDGISEELLNLLAKVPKLRVIARTSSFSFRGKEASIDEIARKLNVAALLEGSVRKSGNAVRITVQLIRASDSTHLWSEDYDRTLDDIFKVQDEIAATVVDKLKISLLGALPVVRPVNAEAYPLLLQANALGNQGSAAGRARAEALYLKVLSIAPDEPRAWSGLGRIYMNGTIFNERDRVEGSRLAKEALNKSLALDPNDGLTYSRLANVVQQVDNDPAGGAPLIQKAMELEPGNLAIIGNAAAFLLSLGRLDESLALFDYRTRRDPANPAAFGNLGNVHYYLRHWDSAIASHHTALNLSPDYAEAHANIGASLLIGKGDAAGALNEFRLEDDELARLTGLALALHALGRKAEADAVLAELIEKHEQDGSSYVAFVYAYRGDSKRAFEWLDKAVANHDTGLSYIHIEPMLDILHGDPRWLPLLREIGRAPEQLAKIEFKVTLPQDAIVQGIDAQTTR